MGLYEEALKAGVIEPPASELEEAYDRMIGEVLEKGFTELPDGTVVDLRG